MRRGERSLVRRVRSRAALATIGPLAAIVVGSLPACRRESRRFEEPSYMTANAAGIRIDEAPASPPPSKDTPGPYGGNAWAIGEGQRLYNQMNCVGCHAHGGGGMGPPLMDGRWIYGSDDASIFTTIVEGRPNGMPPFRGRLSDQQVWQLVSYVHALSALSPQDALPTRDDHMNVRPPLSRTAPPDSLTAEESH